VDRRSRTGSRRERIERDQMLASTMALQMIDNDRQQQQLDLQRENMAFGQVMAVRQAKLADEAAILDRDREVRMSEAQDFKLKVDQADEESTTFALAALKTLDPDDPDYFGKLNEVKATFGGKMSPQNFDNVFKTAEVRGLQAYEVRANFTGEEVQTVDAFVAQGLPRREAMEKVKVGRDAALRYQGFVKESNDLGVALPPPPENIRIGFEQPWTDPQTGAQRTFRAGVYDPAVVEDYIAAALVERQRQLKEKLDQEGKDAALDRRIKEAELQKTRTGVAKDMAGGYIEPVSQSDALPYVNANTENPVPRIGPSVDSSGGGGAGRPRRTRPPVDDVDIFNP